MNPFTVKVKNPETNVENTVTIEEYTPTDGRGKGRAKLRPVGYDGWSLDNAINLWGKAKVWDVICSSRLMQIFTNFTTQATTKDDGKTPETDEGVIVKEFADMFGVLSRRGESIQAISRRLNEVITSMLSITDQLISPDPKLPPLSADAQIKLKNQLLQLRTERADLEKAKLNIIQSKQEDDDEEDDKAPVEVKKAA